jgi:Zinc knuckle
MSVVSTVPMPVTIVDQPAKLETSRSRPNYHGVCQVCGEPGHQAKDHRNPATTTPPKPDNNPKYCAGCTS